MGRTLALLFIAAAAVGIGVSYGPLYIGHVAGVVLAVYLFREIIRVPGRAVLPAMPTDLHWLPVLMALWYAAGMMWSINPLGTARYTAIIVYGSAIVWTVVYTAADISGQRQVFRVLAIIFTIEIIVALLESFSLFRWPVSPFSQLSPYFGRAMTLVVSRFDPATLAVIRSYPTGFEWNPNNLCLVMNLILPFTLFHRSRVIRWGGPAAILTVIVMASSKANFLSYVLMMGLYLFVCSPRRWMNLIATCALAGLLVAGGDDIGAMTARISNKQVQEIMNTVSAVKQLFTRDTEEYDSISMRQKYTGNSVAALIGSCGFGVGGGCAGNEKYQKNALDPGSYRISLHNFWLELVTEGGLLFFWLFALWYWLLLNGLFRAWRNSYSIELRRWAAACALALIGLIPAAVSPSSAIYIAPMWILFGMSIATINNHRRESQRTILLEGTAR